MEKSKKRGSRRDATRRICERRVRDWNHVATWSEYRMVQQPGRFKKLTGWCCDCRKRRKGAPRRSVGMCDWIARDRIYRDRATTRELRVLVRRGDFTEGSSQVK